MNNKGFNSRLFAATLILLLMAQVGCMSRPASLSTPLPGTAAPAKPGVIHFPEVDSVAWVKSVSSVCIQVQQSYTLPVNHTEPIAEQIQGVLNRIGVQATLGTGADCQATLALAIQFTPVSRHVVGAGECYLDAESQGEASLSAGGHKPLTIALNRARSQGGGFGITFISKCPLPDQAPFDSAWAWPVSKMLGEWWGGPALVSALKAKTYALRSAATGQLAAMGPQASGAIPVLVEMLGDADPGTREAAARTLGALGPSVTEEVPALLAAINDSDESARYAVITALGEIGDGRAVPPLIQALHHSNDYTRYVAAGALEKLGPKAAAAVPDLVAVLKDDFTQVGTTAVDALGAIGPDAKSAVPALIGLLEDKNWSPRFTVVDALENITGQKLGEEAAAWRQWWEGQK